MQLRAIQRILGLLLMLFSFTMLPPVAAAWWYQDGAMTPFLLGFMLTLGGGFVIWLPVQRSWASVLYSRKVNSASASKCGCATASWWW